MEQKKLEETAAVSVGMLLLGSGYEKILLELVTIEERDFIDTNTAVRKNETVLGPLCRFEKAAWTLASRIEEDLVSKFRELKRHVCPTCLTCNASNMENAPCRDLIARMELIEQLRDAMWDSIRKRFGGSLPSIGIRSGFVAVKCPSKSPGIDIEIIKVHHGSRELGDILGSILSRVRSGHDG